MRFPLNRFYQDQIQTLGFLRADVELFATVERPWRNNQPFYSRIPAGDYEMNAIEIDGVRKIRLSGSEPERTLINVEVGNWAYQLHGCIGVGLGLGFKPHDGAEEPAGGRYHRTIDSRAGLRLLLDVVLEFDHVPMILEIRDCFRT